ncbi:glutamine cyclotransferase [Flavobacteria bacterium BAL38]|nr:MULTISPECIES: glutaminyl-peptide cyclotransferase [unclassified Flavobacterium]EAZ94872.1 glutamine cyclotransferase [Flavobacteria bacterium BAL38]MQP52789.1 glutaminyl-peptide cyclotransferase [Flavobacterium sp. LMO9]MQP63063.1 glutaminyl-peptide cyclotransferase [Flavobacterium sp. LMO6]
MLKVKLFAFIVLGVISTSCKDDENALKNLFEIDTTNIKPILKLEESVDFVLKNKENKVIDSVIYYVNNVKVGAVKGNEKLHFDLNKQKLGNQTIKALVYFEGKNIDVTSGFSIFSSVEAKVLNFKILNTYPHDIKAYTQGFEFYRDTLFEGTGNGAGNSTGIKGKSSLRKTDYRTGKVLKLIELEDRFFGEGITILNNKVYQLTWRNKEGYVYNADTFKKEKTFTYEMEGWGITNDGEKLYMSDGSEKIYILNPETLKVEDYFNVYTNGSKIESVNELEWINGKIWANIYQKDAIAIIDPKTGSVENVINCAELKGKVTQHPDLDYFNGIAYNPKTKTVFVTGKNWDKTFEITVE